MAVKKKAIVIPVLAVLLAGGGLYAMSRAGTEAVLANTKYTVIPAGQNDLSRTISTNGSVIGNGTVDVTTKLSGCTISEVKVSIGDTVKEGDLLCVFDSADLQEEYDSLVALMDTTDKKTQSGHDRNERDLEATKAKKQTALDRAQRAIDNAVKDRDDAYKEYNDLVDEYNAALDRNDETYDYVGVNVKLETIKPTLPKLDDAVTAANESYKDTELQYDETIQKIQDLIDSEEFDSSDSDRKKLDKLAEQIEQCNVYAPRSGVITGLNVSEGSIPMASSLMTIVDIDKTVIELTIKETDINKVSEGMKAVVTSKVLPDQEFSAKITRIVNVLSADPTGTEAPGYKVEVTLDEANDQLMIGMSATVDITTEDVGEKLSVPYSGIFEENGNSYVFVAVPAKDEEGGYIAEKRRVSTGVDSDFYVEITSGGVEAGDLIIEDPVGGELPDVEEGARIRVNE